MRYHALATDYDGTLARHGKVETRYVDSLRRLKHSGRKLILVTGRELGDLQRAFPEWALFDRIIAENGALLYRPATQQEKVLEDPPPASLVEALHNRGVSPLSVGKVIVATVQAHAEKVLETIRELGLEHQVIFNKGAVMILPSGINKAQGLAAALAELGLSPHNVVSVGDAENDHAMLKISECAVAVANALPSLKDRADLVTRGDHGDGVAELVDRLLATDLEELETVRGRHGILLGNRSDGAPVRFDPYARGVLLAGTSGGGKTTFATAYLEGLSDALYQFCVLDPEGEYGNLENVLTLGDARHAPVATELLRILSQPQESAVACTLAIPFPDRPEFFQSFFTDLLELRSRTGRPHCIMVDEAHHLLPAGRGPGLLTLPRDLRGFFLITLEPNRVSRAVLEHVDWVIAIGEAPDKTLGIFARTLGLQVQVPPYLPLGRGEALVWRRDAPEPPFRMRALPPRTERRRHVRKYSEGELGPDRSFRFRGPEGKLNLRAQNLMIFLQLADGVDDDTWFFHLRRGEYSRWFREAIKDEGLAEAARLVETEAELSAADSRAALRKLIEDRYTGPG